MYTHNSVIMALFLLSSGCLALENSTGHDVMYSWIKVAAERAECMKKVYCLFEHIK